MGKRPGPLVQVVAMVIVQGVRRKTGWIRSGEVVEPRIGRPHSQRESEEGEVEEACGWGGQLRGQRIQRWAWGTVQMVEGLLEGSWGSNFNSRRQVHL